jgi:thiol-disulfide isomerase/thioredoxin
LDRYFNDVLPQHPDSLKLAAGEIIDASRTNPEMFKFILSTLTDKYVNPKFMGQDAVFVYLFEKYYITGQADSWMNEKYRKFIFDRGYSLMANVIGNQGANFEFIDSSGKRSSLFAINGQYTVICFWDPTCSHCKEEVPKLDSLFQQKWKKQGIKLVGMMTEGGKEPWLKFIREHNLKDWVHVYQTQAMKDADYAAGKPGFRQLYDVYQTPMLYLLDKDKRIIAKKLTYQQLDELLEVKIKATAAQKCP